MNKYSSGWNAKAHKQTITKYSHLRQVRIPLLLDSILIREAKKQGGISAVIVKALRMYFLKIKN